MLSEEGGGCLSEFNSEDLESSSIMFSSELTVDSKFDWSSLGGSTLGLGLFTIGSVATCRFCNK